jgi:hypothetical protein
MFLFEYTEASLLFLHASFSFFSALAVWESGRS